MEFDKSKILMVVTADQAKVGSMGYFSNRLPMLEEYVRGYDEPDKLISVNLDTYYPFFDGYNHYSLFYPAPEPTYAERQAEWIKENNVKAGTKVRVTRTFTDDEDGSWCWEHDDLVDMTGSVCEYGIGTHNLRVIMSDGKLRVIPYFALEVIKEPTYRPYNNDELNDLVGEVLTNKKSGRKKLVTGKPTVSDFVTLDGCYITAEGLLSSFYRNTNKPCGIKEEV